MFTGVQFTHFIQANPALAVFLTIALGFLLGKLRIRSFSLGTVTSVLLVGVIVGQLRIEIPEPAKTLFFLMFLFAVGYAVGPQFFRGLKKDGLPQVAFAVVVCLLWHPAVQDALDLLCGKITRVHNYDLWEKESVKDEEHPLAPYHVTEPVELKVFPQGAENVTMEGRLIGGCMDCLVNLLGTRFDHVKEFQERYKEDGFLWFLEACDLHVMSIRRAIWQMKEAGWFSHVKGFLIGRPVCFGEEAFGIDHYRAVTDLLAEYQVPVIMDLDIGHMAPMMPVVTGAMAKAHVQGNTFVLDYEWR